MKYACRGTSNVPKETTIVNGATWGRCPGCGQMRPTYVSGTIKAHAVVDGLVYSPGQTP